MYAGLTVSVNKKFTLVQPTAFPNSSYSGSDKRVLEETSAEQSSKTVSKLRMVSVQGIVIEKSNCNIHKYLIGILLLFTCTCQCAVPLHRR